ncbi:subclass B3 metallo-beta-lactamase [Massilia sp. GCM10020059]|uniref:Subclass B3 metallo-beta-lactamase n=1 Tax=Massilia agrisoli TaxID=2892444 RepID=A0ABS8INN4_9BURK|nr:subclass B3 metallo-beta-lactamase [Massilia agrisoli]MCC6069423.1 subclass B3 metallo-beta-lactamase [Massilia agrisoli]
MIRMTTLAVAAVLASSAPAYAAWNDPQQPFNVFGNTWYVGTKELSAILITSPQGHVLLDGAVPESAPLIEKNIRELGFKVEDVKLIVNSHAHIDHAGGIAALQRASGAVVAASAHGAQVLRDGTIGKDDPQYTAAKPDHFPKVAQVKTVRDGEVLKAGALSVTAHMTPGHTPGSTTWTWQSCDGAKCLDVVYADSVTAVSLGDYRFSGGKGAADVSTLFKASIDKIGALKCDVLLTTHPGASGIMEKLAAKTPLHNPFIDTGACRALAEGAQAKLAARIGSERGVKAVAAPPRH